MFKFDDDNYQIKLRKAINTYLNHVEVTNLKRCATLFLLSLCLLNILLLYFGSMQIGDIISYLNEIGNR